MVLKCYPCIRGCGYVKGVLGAALVGLTMFMYQSTPPGLDCSIMQTNCVLYFGVVLDQVKNVANIHLQQEAQVQDYCKCFTACVNYVSVYHSKGDAKVQGNCFIPSSNAGLQGIATEPEFATGPSYPIGPTLGTTECVTCSAAEDMQDRLSTVLASLSLLCGVAMFVTAGCEHIEIKFHNGLFAIMVLVADVVCGVLLGVAMTASLSAASISHQSCDPLEFTNAINQGGTDTIHSSADQAAIFTNFLSLMLEDLPEGLCHQLRTLTVFSLVTFVSTLANLWSFFVTISLCVGCTDDGIDDHSDDEKALDLHALMNFN